MTQHFLPRTIIRGDDRQVNITVVDASNNPVDITGCRVYFTLNASNNPEDDTGAVTKSTTVHTDPANGKTTILLTHTDTDSISPGPYWFDAQVVDAFGHVTSKLRGRITVEADTTRAHATA